MENMDEKTLVKVYCADCGDVIDEMTEEAYEDLVSTDGTYHSGIGLSLVVDGKVYCPSCKENYAECNECGRFDKKFKMYDHHDGFCYCEDCRNRLQLAYCEHCGDWVDADEIHHVYSDCYANHFEYWCSNCVDNDAWLCDDCDKYYSDADVEQIDVNETNLTICERCRDYGDYYTCSECGEVFSHRLERGRDDEYYCEDCITKYRPIIWEWHQYPSDWQFRHYSRIGFKNPRHIEPHIGAELEIDIGGCDEDNAIDITEAIGYPTNKTLEFKCAEDGSLEDGFEIISMPASYDWHTQHYDWKAGMKKAMELGYESHDAGTCGLHFHIDRKYFEENMVSPEEGYVIITGNNRNWLERFSRRNNYEFCIFQDQSPYNPEDFKSKNHTKTMRRIHNAINGYHAERHSAVNLTGHSTIEIRFCRGTLNYDTFVASLQLMVMMAYAVKHFSHVQLATVDLAWFKRYAKRKNYKEFLAYINNRGIMG